MKRCVNVTCPYCHKITGLMVECDGCEDEERFIASCGDTKCNKDFVVTARIVVDVRANRIEGEENRGKVCLSADL